MDRRWFVPDRDDSELPAPLNYARPGTTPPTRTSRLAVASFLIGVVGFPLITATLRGDWFEQLLPEPRRALATGVRFYALPLIGLFLGSCAVATFRRYPPHLAGRHLAVCAVILNLFWIVLASCVGISALFDGKVWLN
jgi:hypothetical protein